jgi:hypothetical protein
MACGKQTDVAVMDFSKAFDKVDHQRLHVIQPWGMPDNTGQLFDVWPSTSTL